MATGSAPSADAASPTLIVARCDAVRRRGPWADFKGSDLIHLALGGVMMNCGYDPAPGGATICRRSRRRCGTPSTSPASSSRSRIVAALLFRWRTGKGQLRLVRDPRGGGEVDRGRSDDVGDAPRARAAPDVPPRARGRHASSVDRLHTKDGRWVMANLGTRPGDTAQLVGLMAKYGMDAGIDPEKATVPTSGGSCPARARARRSAISDGSGAAVRARVHLRRRAVARGPGGGMLWAPLRKPHENAMDPHWLARRSCADVEHPELGRSFRYATSKWLATGTTWSVGRRAPLLNEDAKRR
jgi:crotonobetainyl-CoA:carnitine CoA-transferase CaiB-like acyl-CoA transferase